MYVVRPCTCVLIQMCLGPKIKMFGCHDPHHCMLFLIEIVFLCFGGMKVFLGSDLDLHDSEFLNLGER